MKNVTQSVLAFPCGAGASGRRELQTKLRHALLISDLPVVIDLSECRTLDHQDVATLLNCVEQSVGRDVQVVFVAGSAPIRLLLEVTRIASLVSVFDSMEEALTYPRTSTVEAIRPGSFELRRSA